MNAAEKQLRWIAEDADEIESDMIRQVATQGAGESKTWLPDYRAGDDDETT